MVVEEIFTHNGIYIYLNLSRWVHRLNIIATAKVTKYLTTSHTILSIYDYFQDKDVQISQSINLGFLYTIQKTGLKR